MGWSRGSLVGCRYSRRNLKNRFFALLVPWVMWAAWEVAYRNIRKKDRTFEQGDKTKNSESSF